MVKNILEMLKNPVTNVIERSENEDIKKGCIKLAIISAILAILNVLSTIVTIILKYSSKNYTYYSSDEIWDRRWSAMKNAELFQTFFKLWLVMALVMAIMAVILFIISRLVKSPKNYSITLSMINSIMSLYIVGFVINILLSIIYEPIGILILFATIVYSSLTLIHAFNESLNIENINSLVIVTTIVVSVAVVISVIILCSIEGVSLKEFIGLIKLYN